MKKLINFFKDEEGASAVEYGILVAAVAAVVISLMFVLGTNTKNAISNVNSSWSDHPVNP
jgi:pilus assembly protein Flp/PilA